MKRKIISILIILMLLMNLIPISFVHAANDSKVSLTVGLANASITEYETGAEITYTVAIQATEELTSIQFALDIPTGLTYVAGSGQLDSDLQTNLGELDSATKFNENKLMVGIVGKGGAPMAINGNVTLATFKCTIDNTSTGNLTVGLKEVDFTDSDYRNLTEAEYSVANTNATITVRIPVNGITLNKSTLNLTSNSSEQLIATVAPATATNKNVNWSSNDATVASVDANGNVTGKKEGTATITATTVDGGFTASCNVTVVCGHTNTTTHNAVASTCISQGNAEYVSCNDCGKVISGSDDKLPLADHNYGTLIAEVPATHTVDTLSEGKKAHYICSVCNKKFNESKVEVSDADLVIPAPEHTYTGDWVATDSTTVPNSNATVDTNTYHWKNCGCGNIIQEAHKGGEATCSNKAICTVCSAEYGDLDNTKHKNTETRNGIEANCTVDGYSGDEYCLDCNTKIKTGIVIPAGHKGGVATCTQKAICEVCGIEYGNIDPLNHINTEIRNAVEATTEKEGYTGDIYCKDCDTLVKKGESIPIVEGTSGDKTETGTETETETETGAGTETQTQTETGNQTTVSNPKTGDDTNILLYIGLLVFSGICFTFIIKWNTKIRKEKHSK